PRRCDPPRRSKGLPTQAGSPRPRAPPRDTRRTTPISLRSPRCLLRGRLICFNLHAAVGSVEKLSGRRSAVLLVECHGGKTFPVVRLPFVDPAIVVGVFLSTSERAMLVELDPVNERTGLSAR